MNIILLYVITLLIGNGVFLYRAKETTDYVESIKYIMLSFIFTIIHYYINTNGSFNPFKREYNKNKNIRLVGSSILYVIIFLLMIISNFTMVINWGENEI